MRRFLPIFALLLTCTMPQMVSARSCPDEKTALGVSRIIEIDVSGGPMFGSITPRKSEPSFLKPKEVVLTFDDGPSPRITNPILRTLDQFCTKATFFAVGNMAITYPQTLKKILARGHTLGGHTWSHPLNLRRIGFRKAKAQIEKGFEAIALAAGQPIAPFFRFPGLTDSRKMMHYLQQRKIGAFTVDVVSDDSFTNDPEKLTRVTLRRIEQHQGGIVLFHDIKRSTAKALPAILRALKKRGYKVVHLRAKGAFKSRKLFESKLKAQLAKKLKRIALRKAAKARTQKKSGKPSQEPIKPSSLPFYGTIGPGKFATMQDVGGPPVTELKPAPRERLKRLVSKRKQSKRRKKKIRLKRSPRSQRRKRRNTTRVRLRGVSLDSQWRMNLNPRRRHRH